MFIAHGYKENAYWEDIQSERCRGKYGGGWLRTVVNKKDAEQATSFLISWNFDPASVEKIMQGQVLTQVVSKRVYFRCAYNVRFTLQLTLSRVSLEDPQLAFHLMPAEMIGWYLSTMPIEACGSVISPNVDAIAVTLDKVIGGAVTKGAKLDVSTPHHISCTQWHGPCHLLSLVHLALPRCLQPVCVE